MLPRLVAGILLSALAVGAALAQTPEWFDVLDRQLRTEKQCTLAYLSGIEETPLGEGTLTKARAHCEDGRAYDVTREPGSTLFLIAECGVQTC